MSRLCGLDFNENLSDQLFRALSNWQSSVSASEFIAEAPSKELESSRPVAGLGIGLTTGGGAAGSTDDSLARGTSRSSRRRAKRSQYSSLERQDDPVSTSLPQPLTPGRVEPHHAPMVQVAADRAKNASFSVPLPRADAQPRRGGWSCGPKGRAPRPCPVAQEAPHAVHASLKPGQQDSTKPPGTPITSVPPGNFTVPHQSPATLEPSNAGAKSVFQEPWSRNGAQYVVRPRDVGRVGPRNVSLSELLYDTNTHNHAASSAASVSPCGFVPPQCKVGFCGALAEERMLSRTNEVSTSDQMKIRSEEGASGEVRLYLKADDLLKSSSASLRDADVSFTDQGLCARIIDSEGGCRTIRTAHLPGDIESGRCTYKVGKDGRDLILKLMKKDTSEQWTSEDVRFACVGDGE